MSAYLTILRRLSDAQLEYVLVGGMAVNLHGVPRMTYDIDFLSGEGEKGVLGIHDLLLEMGYRCRLPIRRDDLANPVIVKQWIEERNLKALTYYHSDPNYPEIDIVLDSPITYKEVRLRAIIFKAEDIPIPTASISDLVKMKEISGREQDKSDIKALIKIRSSGALADQEEDNR